MAITNLISNKREWNNCFIKFINFGTLVYLETKFDRFLILQNDRKFSDVAKTRASGLSHGMRTVCKLG